MNKKISYKICYLKFVLHYCQADLLPERSTVLAGENVDVDRCQYWQGAWIWNTKPHVLNKCLFGQKLLGTYHCCSKLSIDEMFTKLQSIADMYLPSDSEQDVINRISLEVPTEPCSTSDCQIFSEECYLIIRRLLFKNKNYTNPLQISYINYSTNHVLYYKMLKEQENTHPSIFSFVLQWKDKRISAEVLENSHKTISHAWLESHLLPKLVKWASESKCSPVYQEKTSGSLQLIDIDIYNELYLHWKEKHGRKLVQNWTEDTDPLKFVYEDIAIAAYLHLLWGREKVNFVDLGCGNGLLVHILNLEGHRGRGIDIRARKIWSLYPPSTILEVGTVTPEDNCLFPDADWLIGNHSDELTPWIPIFATRCSSSCKFFLLPCCAYELNGQRFQRRNASSSVYSDYILYVKAICKKLDFETFTDRLRIPSTKRICIIGDRRLNYKTEELISRIKDVLSNFHSDDFKARDPVERVRNCTKVDRSITTRICDIISANLIRKQLAELQTGNSVWSTNYSISFKDAITLLDASDLKKLKSECGGLQTVLKNNHSVFMIRNSRIFFRKPTEKKIDPKWKKKPCWFFYNHPLKCPLSENKCSYSHE